MSEIVEKKNRSGVLLIAVVVLLLIGVAAGWWMYSHPGLNRYDAALAAIKDHHVKSDGSGRLDFSKDFPGLVPKDEAYATWLGDGNIRALFPTDLGEGSGLIGLMYTSRPLTDDDTQPRATSSIHFDQRLIKVGSYEGLILDKKLNENWYEVSYRIH